MVYDGIREADLAEACVELTVWDRDRLASNLLGGLRLGSGTGTPHCKIHISDSRKESVHHLEHRLILYINCGEMAVI